MGTLFTSPFGGKSQPRLLKTEAPVIAGKAEGLMGRNVKLMISILLIAALCSCSVDNGDGTNQNLNLDTITLTYETAPIPGKAMTNLSRPDTTVFPGDTLLVELLAPKNAPPDFNNRATFELKSDKHCTVKKKAENTYYVYVSPMATKYVIVSSWIRRPNTLFRFAMKDDYGKVIDYFCERDLSCEANHAWPIDSAASAKN